VPLVKTPAPTPIPPKRRLPRTGAPDLAPYLATGLTSLTLGLVLYRRNRSRSFC